MMTKYNQSIIESENFILTIFLIIQVNLQQNFQREIILDEY
jgi:hypothetical protein